MIYDNYDLIFILDACRYGYFERALKKTSLKGELTKFNTGRATTFEWYKKYWSKPNQFHLITENPQPYHKNSGLAHKNFKSSKMSFGSTWLEVDPEKTIKSLIIEPNEKYLVHLLPPDLPYVFGEGAELMKKLNPKATNIYFSVQQWGRKNGFDKLKQYYQEQIEGVLGLIESELHNWTERKILITADHGELLGDKQQYDHPPNPDKWQKEFLYNVPFFEVNIEESLVEQRLKMLGYT